MRTKRKRTTRWLGMVTAVAALFMAGSSVANAGTAPTSQDQSARAVANQPDTIYQLHGDGSIWRSMGSGWTMLDNNPKTVQISAGAGTVFQLHNDGEIYRSTGAACNGSSCPGWTLLDNNPKTVQISAGAGTVFQLHNDGEIYRSTGAACSGGSCSGWTLLDDHPSTSKIAAGAGTVFQIRGTVPLRSTIWRSTGAACSGGVCSGWQELDGFTAAMSANSATVYEVISGRDHLHKSTGAPCDRACDGWDEIDIRPSPPFIAAIAAGGTCPAGCSDFIYELRDDGSIWRSFGAICSSFPCPGWTQLDNNPGSAAIAAGFNGVFQLRRDGSIWQSIGGACSGSVCNGWVRIDNNPATVAIAVTNQF